MKRLITVLALMGVLALAACGGSEDEQEPTSAATATPTQEATAEPTEQATAEPQEASAGPGKQVAIKGFAFSPATVKVKAGQKIVWENADEAPHTVTAKSGGELDSGTVAQGVSFDFTPEEAGTIEYFCEIHPSMTGTIEVSS